MKRRHGFAMERYWRLVRAISRERGCSITEARRFWSEALIRADELAEDYKARCRDEGAGLGSPSDRAATPSSHAREARESSGGRGGRSSPRKKNPSP